MASRLFSADAVPSMRRTSNLETPLQSRASISSLKRTSSSLHDLVTPASKRKNVETPASIERIKTEQARRSLTGQLSSLERQLVDLQAQLRDSRAETAERDRRVARLEEDRQIIAERELEFKKERRETEAALRAERDGLLKERDRERQRATDAVETAQTAETEMRRATHAAELSASKAAAALGQLDMLQEELQKSDEELSRARAALEAAEQQRDQLAARNEELERRIRDGASTGNDDQMHLIREELHRQVNHLKTLEGSNGRLSRENAVFKERAADAAVLREKVQTLETKLKVTDKLHRELAASQTEVESLRQMHEEWLVFLRTDDEATTQQWESPRQVGRALAAAQIEIASLEDRLSSMAGNVKNRDGMIEALEARLDETELKLVAQVDHTAEAEVKRRRDGRLLDLVKREADMLREQLRTYAVEETAIGGSSGSRSDAIAGLDEVLDAHKRELHESHAEIERLQGLLEASGGVTAKLADHNVDTTSLTWRQEGKLAHSLTGLLKANETIKKGAPQLMPARISSQKRTELSVAQDEAALLTKEIASLEATCERLTAAVGRGEFDRTTTRVLQLTDNPASQDLAVRTATLEALKAENAALLARVASSAAGNEKSGAAIPAEALKTLEQEKARLENELDQVQKRAQRRKEVFDQQAMQLRQAVYALLGYKIDIKDSGRVRVTSKYATGEKDHLIFETVPGVDGKAGGGSMPLRLRLMGGTGEAEWAKAPSVQNLIQFWVNERQSIPGFLSSLTLEGYDSATSGGKHLGFTQG